MRFDTNNPPPSRRGLKAFLSRNRGALVATVIVASLIALQWPFVKGMFYRVAGGEPRGGGISWRTDFAAALEEARKSGKPLLVDFAADWCPPCQTMKHEVWPDKQVGELVEKTYVPVFVDLTSAGNEIAARFGVASIPTVLVLDADGKVLHRAGFMSRSSMIDFLNRHAPRDKP